MYLYGDEHRPVRTHAWNAVNVRDNKGVLRHVNVISAVDDGLIIDFDYPNQLLEFVAYGKAFNYVDLGFLTTRFPWVEQDFTKNGDIYVLIRVRPDQPWTWLPGKLLELNFCPYARLHEYAFVEVDIKGHVVRELLPTCQVRLPLSDDDLEKQVVGKEYFVMRACSLVKDYRNSVSPILSSLFSRNLERKYEVLSISVLNKNLIYLQRRSENPIQPEQLEELFNKCEKEITSYKQRGRKYPNVEWICRHIFSRTYSRKSLSLPKAVKRQLPVGLLAEVFQCLDTIDRLRCMRICSLWSAVLHNQFTFTDIRVSFNVKSISPSPDYDWESLYTVIGCLVKCVNHYTQRIIITDVRENVSLDDMMGLINPLMKNPRMKHVIFKDSTLSPNFGKNMELAINDIVRDCARFDVLTFQNCNLFFEMTRDGFEDTFEVAIPFGSVRPSAADAAIQIWDLVEINCGVFGRKQTAERISSQPNGKAFRILNKVQSCDPRTTTHYRGMEWIAQDVSHLDESKLTPVTLAAMGSVSIPRTYQ